MTAVSVIHCAYEKNPHVVAFVEVDEALSLSEKLEAAFDLTNSINGKLWWKNKEITAMFGAQPCRSTMVGDQMLVGNEKYECLGSGWKKLDSHSDFKNLMKF